MKIADTPSNSFGPELGGPGLVVRRARGADADALQQVAAVTFPLACPPNSTPENIAAFVAANLSAEVFAHHLVDPARTIFLAELDGVPAGYTMLVAEEPHDPDVAAAVIRRPTVELSKCYVMPGLHGRGVAHALMAVTVEEARERGAKSIWLGVNDQNARANRFYEKSGFVTVGTKSFRLGDRLESDFVKERVL